MIRLLFAHRDAIAGAFSLACAAAGLILPAVLGPTLDAQSTLTACEGCGKTAYAANQP
ncbi:hypothetical protein [Bordetella bronchiseptica]|uniref:hypothetical protein n=1 Tax=Bordetella bronchiseptica TaxID=518 RepID=UPI00049EC9FF|nr:hypothetical protein [Bordetella bronchiseptica]KDB58338.1 hypothetical protein AZ15_1968 [Bordetella bronchiseptica A1-7]KDB69665.1 hypothetical protein AZ21_3797 [Bordetella bronchiseptica B20-10725633]KDB70738.1 hypothetical protein AZ21_1759 [Bordetella bronchiseptica B20-10725633]KDB73046.1 hypothetical protein AZ21_2221 [Bordetella bronchiseptica B20-10725633]